MSVSSRRIFLWVWPLAGRFSARPCTMFLNSISGPGTWYLPSAEHLRVAGSHSPYAAQVQAELMGKIVFEGKVDEVASVAEVAIRAQPNGSVEGFNLTRSSGSEAWDQAVLRAVQGTTHLPQAGKGKMPSTVIVQLRPQ